MFKVGDKVRIKPDLTVEELMAIGFCTPSAPSRDKYVKKFAGKDVTISLKQPGLSVTKFWYHVEENPYSWPENLLERRE